MSLKQLYPACPRTERGKTCHIASNKHGNLLLYGNGTSVYIRPIDAPEVVTDVYAEHSRDVTVAKYSPSGYYIASADATGRVRVWDTTQKEHPLKSDLTPLTGRVNDVSWDADSQRLGVGVDGREKFAHVVTMDTGNSVGDIIGHDKPVNACDFKPTRPFRFVTASEDRSVVFFEGPPFKFKRALKHHTNFVNAVRYAPSGEHFATAGQDGKVFLHDGKNGDLVRELTGAGDGTGDAKKPLHAGGIYQICWSPDSTRLLTASGDKSVKLVDPVADIVVARWQLGATVDDMALGCAWLGSTSRVAVLTLSGRVQMVDTAAPDAPMVPLFGHAKQVTTVACHGSDVYSGSHDGRLCAWTSSVDCQEVRPTEKGGGHKPATAVVDLASMPGARLLSIGHDDAVCVVDGATKSYEPGKASFDSQPKTITRVQRSESLAVVACHKHVAVVRLLPTGQVSLAMSAPVPNVSQTPRCAAGRSIGDGDDVELYVGYDDQSLAVYRVQLTPGRIVTQLPAPAQKLTLQGDPNRLAVSPDAKHLACADALRFNSVWSIGDGSGAAASTLTPVVSGQWRMSSANVTSLAWSPDSRRLATGSVDTGVIVYSLDSLMTFVQIPHAHPLKPVTTVAWLDDSTVVSGGQDCCVRLWQC